MTALPWILLVSLGGALLVETGVGLFFDDLRENPGYGEYRKKTPAEQAAVPEPEEFLFSWRRIARGFPHRWIQVLHQNRDRRPRRVLLAALEVSALLAAWSRFGVSPSFFLLAVLLQVLLFLSFVDASHRIIPTAAAGAILVLAGLSCLVTGEIQLLSRLGGLALGGGLFFVLALGGGMGGGDVRLMAAAGLLLGLQQTAVAIFLSLVSGASVSLLLIAMKKKSRKDTIPFGPFLSWGIYLSALYYPEIVAFLSGL